MAELVLVAVQIGLEVVVVEHPQLVETEQQVPPAVRAETERHHPYQAPQQHTLGVVEVGIMLDPVETAVWAEPAAAEMEKAEEAQQPEVRELLLLGAAEAQEVEVVV